MQPKSKVKLDDESLKILKNTIKNIAVPRRERKKDPGYATKLPEVVGIKLTNRCNLRCTHCYEWNEEGYHHFMDEKEQNMDLDFEMLKKVIQETKEAQSRLYLWGGEPLCYSDFGKIAEILEKENREVTMCTNGLLVEKNMDSIIKLSSNLELLIPVEGFEKEHDAIRGKGNFKKVMETIDFLGDLRRKGIFKGRISVHTVINDAMIGKMYSLLEFFESKCIDFVMLCYPWYISDETSKKMDDYFSEHFSWLGNEEENKSWHSFKYKINPDNIPALMEEIQNINKKVWNMRVRYQPGLELNEIEGFVLGNSDYKIKQEHCLVLSNRMDVIPGGDVPACKFFNELYVGNLKENSLPEIWHSEQYRKIRETIHFNSMPVCSKCSALYLNGG